MKKVKKLLVTAIAALSLTACSFEDVKGYATTAGEKIVEVWNNLLEKVGIKKKDEKKSDTPCEHKDENNDFVCDLCGAELEIKSVVLDTKGAKLAFAVNDEFDASGVKVIATSEVGSKKELEFTTSTPDMSTTGTKTVTVSAKVGNETKTFEYSINVSYWSDEDIKIFSAASLTEYAPLPYLAGHNMHVEYEVVEQQLVDWAIVAEDIDNDVVLEYNSMLLEYEEVVEIDGYDVTFALAEVAIDADDFEQIAEDFGLAEVLAGYVLIPSTVYQGNVVRYFGVDEYFLLGIDEEGRMVLKNRLNNSAFDGMFDSILGITRFDGSFSLSAGEDADLLQLYGEIVDECIGNFYSELASDLIIFPEAGTGADAFEVYPANLFSEYPFDPTWDASTLALEFEVWGASQEDLDAYFAALVEAGYEYDAETDSYSIGNDFAGYIQVSGFFVTVPTASATYTVYVFDWFYFAPEEYVTAFHPAAVDLLGKLEIEEYELDSDYYSQYGELDAWFFLDAEEATEEKTAELVTLEALATKLAAEGYVATEAPAMGTYYGLLTAAVASFTDYKTFNIAAYVFEPEDGECEVVFEIKKYYSFTIEDVLEAVFGEVTPTLSEGTYSAVMQEYAEGETPSMSGVGTVVSAAAGGASEIANIDYNILIGDGYYYFSALTKDGKYIFTVYAYAGQTGYSLDLEVEELGLKESLVRDTLDVFSSVGPVRYGNYELAQDGSVTTSLKFGTGLENTVLSYIVNYVLPEDFEFEGYEEYVYETIPAEEEGGEDTIIYGTIYTFSNGEVDYLVDVVDDGTNTLVDITVSDVTPSESI